MKTTFFIFAIAALGFCSCKKESPAPAPSAGPAGQTNLGTPNSLNKALENWYFCRYPETRTLFPINTSGQGC